MKTNIIILIFTFFTLSSFVKPQKNNLGAFEKKCTTITVQQKSLKGVYTRTKRGLYKSLEFKGTKTVVIKPFIGWASTATYERDGNTIIIVVGSASLGFEIINNKTIIGKGVAKGTYIK